MLPVCPRPQGPVADLYQKIGSARAVVGSGDAAYESAAAHFFPTIAFVLGRPGSGKTTACGLLRAKYGYAVLNLDALVKAEAESGSRFGRDIAALVALGDQVSPCLLVCLVLACACRRFCYTPHIPFPVL